MSLTPKPTSYPVSVLGQTVTVSVTDYGPTAHLVARTDANSDDDPDVMQFFGALQPFFFAHINKPCLVQIPSASFLMWGEEPELSVSWPDLNYGNPFRTVTAPAGHWDKGDDDDESGEEVGARR